MKRNTVRFWYSWFFDFTFIALGAFLASFALEVFLFPNNLIDGGVVGMAMIGAYLLGKSYFVPLLFLFNLPFLFLAFKSMGKSLLIRVFYALLLFSMSSLLIRGYTDWEFHGEVLEVVVVGGAFLGIGIGLIIRCGGCLDGTEILGVLINKKTGFTVGQVVLVSNIFIFGAAGLAFRAWHPPILSLITYMVVIKVMDSVIVGLDETKSVLIISSESRAIAAALMHELGLGLTIMYGRGGFSGDAREILYVIAERLQLSELKEVIYRYDPFAFVAIENLHEVTSGRQPPARYLQQGNRWFAMVGKLLGMTKPDAR